MKPTKIQITYVGLQWDGTIEGANQICEELKWLRPWWEIDNYSGLKLEIHERTPGSNSKTWDMRPGDSLVCEEGDDRLDPVKVVPAVNHK